MTWVAGGVTAASGFRASGVSAGIKRSRKPDMALVVSDVPAVCAATFTVNRVKAAPVLLSRQRVRRGRARAVLLNSGCANCMTGEPGLRDAVALSGQVARALGVAEREVLVASTGLIGRRLPVARMQRKIPLLVRRLSRHGHRRAALGILTTDAMAKEAAVAQRLGGRRSHVGGMAKGAGMIAPNMATMLCVLTTDVAIDGGLLSEMLREAVERSFNRISVDGDMSTNDTVFILANGRCGARIRRGTTAARQFAAMLTEVARRLAHLIVKDGEGATRVATIAVAGARTEHEALACARSVASSSLVRTMLAGGDPNVGRIAAAAGASAARFRQEDLEIRVQGRPVVRHGMAARMGKALAKSLFAPREIAIQLDLHAGRGRAQMVCCDLTEAYVRLNAHYST
mgnify:CR=1 FL=1